MPRLTLLIVNALTIMRFGLAVAIILAASASQWSAVLVYATIAFATDWVDGILARHWRVVSTFGTFTDPLADKAVCLAVLWPVALHYNEWPYWICAVVISLYDICTITMRLFIRRTTGMTINASKLAQWKTALLMGGLSLVVTGIIVESIANTPTAWQNGIRYSGIGLLFCASMLAVRSLWLYGKSMLATKNLHSPRRHHRVRLIGSIAQIDFKAWHRYGITCLLLDIEGTVAPWNTQDVPPEIVRSLACARAAGIRDIALISNIPQNEEHRVQQICKKIGVESYWIPRHVSERKPSITMLRYAMRHFNVAPRHVAYAGDKVIDVIAGKRAGVGEIVWVRRLGRADHPADLWFYRPIEPVIRQLVTWLGV